MPNIDPSRTADAAQKYVELGATHLDQVALDHNGSSGRVNRAKLEKQYKDYPTPPWAQKGGANGQPA